MIALFVVAVLITGTLTPMSFAQNPSVNNVRVIAQDGPELSNAFEKGCKLVRDIGSLNALICTPEVARSLGLAKDIRVHAFDSGANTQIGANIVQSNGNTGTGGIVAVLDTGYNEGHSELSSSYLGGYDFIQNDNTPEDRNGHGSHVAGLITANGNRATAIGVAPDTGIYAFKVLDNSGSGYFSDVIAAFNLIVNGTDNVPDTGDEIYDDVDAMNLSLGTSSTWTGYCDNLNDPTVNAMIRAINNAKENGISVVIAAGNSPSGVSFPGCLSPAITVSAVTSNDNIASFSGRGAAIDIAAPGVSLYSVYKNNYAYLSGTSMATPVVAGTIALLKTEDPTLTSDQVESALYDNSVDLGNSNYFGNGRVDALAAVTSVQVSPVIDDTPPEITNVHHSDLTATSATINWTTDDPSDSLVRFGTSSDNLDSIGFATEDITGHSVTLTGLNSDTTYYYEVESTNTSDLTTTDDNSSSFYFFTTNALDVTPPSEVTGLSVVTINSSELNLSWTANGESDLDYYNVYRSSSESAFVKVGSSNINSYSDTGLSASTTYDYKVSAVDTSGNESDLSSQAPGTTSDATKMHVHHIDILPEWKGKGGKAKLTFTVTIADDIHNAVSGADVYVRLLVNGNVGDSANASTDQDGLVTFVVSNASSDNYYELEIMNVVKNGWVYDSNDNEYDSNFIFLSFSR
jgi:subtilisin family serine protease